MKIMVMVIVVLASSSSWAQAKKNIDTEFGRCYKILKASEGGYLIDQNSPIVISETNTNKFSIKLGGNLFSVYQELYSGENSLAASFEDSKQILRLDIMRASLKTNVTAEDVNSHKIITGSPGELKIRDGSSNHLVCTLN